MSKNPIFQERKKHVNQMSKYLIFQEVKKKRAERDTPDKKNLKKPYFSGETKKTWHPGHFLYIWKIFFFSPPEILSILHAWHPGHFLVIFLEKFMIFCKWTKKCFFNVNPYHFQTHAWHPGHKKKFFSKGICQLLVFFFPKKKKKFFFFRAPKFLKNPAKNLPSDQRITTSQAFLFSKKQNISSPFH